MYYKMKWLFPCKNCYCFSWISIYELSCFLVLKNVYYTVGINEILAPTGTGIYYIRVLWPSQSSLNFSYASIHTLIQMSKLAFVSIKVFPVCQ